MIYRMLALNVDRTLLQTNGRLNKSTKEAIQYAQSKGIYVTIVSSKHFLAVKRIAKSLKIDNHLVTHQGAYIASELEKPIFVRRLSDQTVRDLVQLFDSYPCQIRLIHEKHALATNPEKSKPLLAKSIFTPAISFFYSIKYTDTILEDLETQPMDACQLEIAFHSKKDLHECRRMVENSFHEVDCVLSNDHQLHIVPKGISKLRGLMYLCDRLGMTMSEVVMIGSGLDDQPCIECSGLGVAMGDAPQEVKRSADWITRSADENGVAYVVKELFRKQQPIEFLKKLNVIKK
ncbi:Cof-type HAD-IIB family hydrolase [Aeribacillus pallidus]|uniref:Cof-type HAD-IIB family hydrolase n=1 Tax=Aeribacillus pallidus TaxID=33936 RepID=UPI003D224CAD